ncbi:YciI family protein [Aquisalinus flavus]|uniref:YCII-related domain-containing protein n=1 Tax=Aquisalinus flavus TaxID=1526572 RepID=A0A8J2V5I9_9PROT|nr:YciI family protein [Aquisalinus flavus]MBD0427644.1 hypothetical protein [Aquisalinus flavus]UNE47431.1 hypothetical protein FF099_04815 [Aquisalinus flavus]GGD02661.1 hypothetical protein GCM10011342_09580 [Aquisalinus flavus]
MKYMILVAETEKEFAMRNEAGTAAFEAFMAPWFAYSSALAQAGVILGGQALMGPETATTVRIRDGKRIVEDGPYADAKEQLGGFFVIDVPDADTARDWAAKAPTSSSGHTDLRKVMPFDGEA